MSTLKPFLSAILAGALFTVAAIARIESGSSKIVASFIFGICILVMLTLKLSFISGRIGYVFSNPKKLSENLSTCSIIFLGNVLSVAFLGLLLSSVYGEAAEAIVKNYASVHYLEILVKSIFCGALLFAGVHCYRRLVGSGVGSVLVISSTAIIVYCGFIHGVSEMFYLFASLSFSVRSVLYVVISVAGNIFGSLGFAILYEAKKEDRHHSSHHHHNSEEESKEA